MNNLGYEQAMQLRAALMPIAYLLCTTGLILSVFRHWNNFHEVLMSIIGVAVIVILINGYPTALTTIADGFKQLREQTPPTRRDKTGRRTGHTSFRSPLSNPIGTKSPRKLKSPFARCSNGSARLPSGFSIGCNRGPSTD